jgi:hypothetical protein
MAAVDDLLIMRAMSGPQEHLTKEDSEQLMEFLWKVRSGGELSSEQRGKLQAIVEKARSGRRA